MAWEDLRRGADAYTQARGAFVRGEQPDIVTTLRRIADGSALGEIKTDIREVRDNHPFRWVPWAMLLLRLCNMFAIAILALERGVDPTKAAEAVKMLAPGVGPTSPHGRAP